MMTILTGAWSLDLTLVLASALLALYVFYKVKFQFWKRMGVPQTTPTIPFGDVGALNFTKNTAMLYRDIYEAFPGQPFAGMYTFFKPTLVIRDLDLVKTILVKDFMAFHDRGIYVNDDDPLAGHLFAISGAKWRNLRGKLTPTFTSGKMKMMFPALMECGKELVEVLHQSAVKGEIVEMKDLAARFTTDIISSCAFGLQTNSLKHPDAIFRKMGKKIFEPGLVNGLRNIVPLFAPKIAELLKMKNVAKDVSEFFLGAIKETIDYREQNNVKRNDFMQLLIQLKNKGRLEDIDKPSEDETREGKHFTFEETAAQAFVFFLAGFETSSTAIQFALYLLALNPDIQETARAEIKEVLAKHDGKLTYENMFEMEYVGRVVDETLRLYPPAPVVFRGTTKNYQLPGTDIVLPKGIQVQVPIYGIHHDPQYFPDPEKFDPDRFTEEEKAKRPHYAYLPFGEGPRNCIGARFGLMEARVGLITMLDKFRFEVCEGTIIPAPLDPQVVVLAHKGGMYLRVTSL